MPDDFDVLFEDVTSKIGMIVEMTQTAIKQAEPEVDWIISTKSKDSKLIESMLDRLMDYSLQCADDGLPLPPSPQKSSPSLIGNFSGFLRSGLNGSIALVSLVHSAARSKGRLFA